MYIDADLLIHIDADLCTRVQECDYSYTHNND